MRTILLILLLAGLPLLGMAQVGIIVGVPHDDPNVRKQVYELDELKLLITQYERTIQTLVETVRDRDISEVFGPRLLHRGLVGGDPTNSVAPLFAPYTIFFRVPEGKGKPHQDLYAVGDIGHVEFFYEHDGRLKTSIWYALLDQQFISLKSSKDLPARLAWDKAKFAEFRRWLDAHPKLKTTPQPELKSVPQK